MNLLRFSNVTSRNRPGTYGVTVMLLAPWLICHVSLQAADRLTDLDGKVQEVAITAIDPDGKVSIEGSSRKVDLNTLRRIDRPSGDVPTEETRPKEAVFVTFAAGGTLQGSGIRLEDDTFLVDTLAGTMKLSIDDVHAFRFGETHELYTKALREPDDEYDRFLLRVGEDMTTIRGFIESMDDREIHFERDDTSQSLPREKAYGVVLATIDSDLHTPMKYMVGLHDGSLIPCEQLTLVNQMGVPKLTTQLGGGSITMPWTSISHIAVRSDRLVYLSDLDPVDAIEQSIIALPRTWKRNQNIRGKPLKIGEQIYASGIGVQSRSALTYDTTDSFSRFTATIGIDAGATGKGDCEFVVRGDGRELLRQRMRAADRAKSISVDIADVQRLQLIVEPGANLDFGDHANWCDACLVR